MLEQLKVKSVGGVQEACLLFGPGLTVITGESGAGKSSLIRALEMVAGRRGSVASIRGGDEMAWASALFVTDVNFDFLPPANQPQEGELIVTREFHRGGRGKCSMQNSPLPLADLAKAMGQLMTLQSQFAQLELLDPERQLELVDAAGGNPLSEVKITFLSHFQQLAELSRAAREDAQQELELKAQYGNVEQVLNLVSTKALAGRSLSDLELDLTSLESRIKKERQFQYDVRTYDDGEGGGLRQELMNLCSQLVRHCPENAELEDAFAQLQSSLDGFANALRGIEHQSLEELEERIDATESLVGRMRKASRLAKVEYDALPEWLKKAEQATEWLLELGARRAQRQNQIQSLTQKLIELSQSLGTLRQEAAHTLCQEVNRHLKDLAMGDCIFGIVFEKNEKIKITGAERVIFTLQRGKSDPLPVAKNASGGELSRTLLALQLALPRDLLPPTIIFDEVEAGLGGKAALLTGMKLKELSASTQVILVTHEAIIAAKADAHWGVCRHGTETTFQALTGEERVQEIARMLSGQSQDEKSQLHARHLLQQSPSDLDTAGLRG